MAGVKAATLQYVLNSTPMLGWAEAYKIDTTFMAAILGGPVPKEGNFQANVKTSRNSSGGSFAESDTITTAGSVSRDRVTFNIARYYKTVSIDGLISAKAAGGAYDQLVDILMEEVDDAVESLLDEVNDDLISSGSVTDADGVPYYIATGSGISEAVALEGVNVKYGDKTRAEYYSSFVTSASTGSLTFSLMDAVHHEMLNVRHSNYDQIWCSSYQRMAYEDLLRNSGSSVFYVDAQVGDRSFKALTYNGRPIIEIPGYATDRMDFVRSRDWSYQYSPVTSTNEAGNKIINGWLKVTKLAKTTDDDTYSIIHYGNLVCTNPWKQATILALAT